MPMTGSGSLSVVMAAVASQREYQMEFRQRRADGEFRWVLSTAVPRFAGAEYAGHIGTVVDITQLKRDQEQGLAAQKLESLGVLAGGVAHDFNNLLGSILADSELLLADLADDSPVHDGIKRIEAVAVRAAEIVRELLTFAGQENPSFEPVDVSNLVREMLELLKVSISKHAEMRMDLADDLPAVRANASQIRQIVMNLITNASEALGQEGGVIAVSTRLVRIGRDSLERGELPEGEYVRLRVSDTGCGMTREIQDKIFDPFFTTKFAGRGLGLAAVQGIVRSHRGSIHLASAPGAGTRFEILLPCAQEAVRLAPDVLPPDSAVVVAPSVTGTVLVVDDEEMLRIAVCKMLRKERYTVIEAGDGDAALELFRANAAEIGVILLDMTLPGISGRKLFEELRRIRPDVRVILTTAYTKEMATNAIGTQQAWGFIRKPYHIADLIGLLRRTETSAGENAVPGGGAGVDRQIAVAIFCVRMACGGILACSDAMLRLIRDLIAPYRWTLCIVFVAMVIETAMSLAGPWPLKIVLDNVVGSHHLPGWLDAVVKHVAGGAGKMQIAGMAAIGFVLIAAISGIASYVENYYTESVGQWVAHDLRLRTYHHLQRLSLRYYEGHQIGVILSTLTTDIATIQNFASSGTLGMVVDLFTIVGNAGADVLAELRLCAGGHRGHAISAAVCLSLQEGDQEGHQGGSQESERNRYRGGAGSRIGAGGEGVRHADTRRDAASRCECGDGSIRAQGTAGEVAALAGGQHHDGGLRGAGAVARRRPDPGGRHDGRRTDHLSLLPE